MKPRRTSLLAPLAMLSLLAVGCSHSPPPPSLTRNLTLAELEQAARFKNPSTVTIVALTKHKLTNRKKDEGKT